MKNFILSLLLIVFCMINSAHAQNMAINTDGSTPDASAMVDIASTTKGFLLPRMTTTQQNAIPSPATGLLIFNTTDNVFKVNTGTPASPVWTPLLFNGGSGSIASINGLTNSTQTFATGATGTDFGITSAGSTHTFNLPTASATNRGLLSAADWTTFNGKQNALGFTPYNATNPSGYISSSSIAGATDATIASPANGQVLQYNFATGKWVNTTPTYLSSYTETDPVVKAVNGIVKSNGTTISAAVAGTDYVIPSGNITGTAANVTGIVAVPNGGTGLSSVTTGDLLYGSAANTFSKLPAGTNGQILTLTSGIPSWVTNPGTSAWSLTGNSVTAGSHFLGSTNNVSLRFRTNNLERMLIDSTGKVGIGTNTLTEALNVNGNIALATTTAKVIGNNGNITLEQNGDGYGTTRLSIQNRNGVNGAMFEQAGTVDLVDFVFKGLTNQRNIRFENRSSFSYLGYPAPEFQIGIGSDPTLVVADNAAAFRKGNVAIGTMTPTALLHLSGGTATASTAPLKFTAGTNLTTPENGAVEFNGTHFYGTVGATRYQLDQQGGGTVTSASVVSANGFTGSVATPTTTPAITLGTSITGILKGSAGAIAAATAGTDYLTPTGSAAGLTSFPTLNQNTTGTAANVTGTVAVVNGGTGLTSVSTGDLLYGSAANTYSKLPAGTNGQVLTLTSGIPSWIPIPVAPPGA